MKTNPQRLLMIAYYFPPLGGAGVQRSAKFAKYLAKVGWQIEVVSVVPPAFEPRDETLLAEIQTGGITVHRVECRERFRGLDRLPGGWRVRGVCQDWLLFPDRMAGWFDPAYQAAAAICRQHPGIPVFTTSAPYTAHLIGLRLKQEFGGFWAVDFRDEWSQNPYLNPPTGRHRRQHCRWEAEVLRAADLVISVTDPITEGLRSLVPDATGRFATIPNGFDPDDVAAFPAQRTSQFTMTHVGTLNAARGKLVAPVLQSIKRLIDIGNIPPEQIRVNLIGPGNFAMTGITDSSWVRIRDYLPHHEALAAMAASDLLILAESNPAAFTGKIFEYLGLKRPILGVVHPESPAARLIRDASAGWVIGLDDPASQLAELFPTLLQKWRAGEALIRPKESVIAAFDRRSQAARLAELILKGQSGDDQ